MDKKVYSFRKYGKQLVAVAIAAVTFANVQSASADSWTVNTPDQIQIEPGQTSYTMKAGDTLWAIGQKINLTVEFLARINGIDLGKGEEKTLPIGRVIYWYEEVEGQEQVTVDGKIYVVEPQDKLVESQSVGRPVNLGSKTTQSASDSFSERGLLAKGVKVDLSLPEPAATIVDEKEKQVESGSKTYSELHKSEISSKVESIDGRVGTTEPVEALEKEEATPSEPKKDAGPILVEKNTSPDRVHVMQVARQAADFIVLESDGLFGLVDAGAINLTTSKSIVYPYLESLGVKEFEFLLLTHLHGDHTGYLGHFKYPDGAIGTLLDDFVVKRVILKDTASDPNAPSSEINAYNQLVRHLEAKGVPYAYEDSFALGELSLNVYNEENLSETELTDAVAAEGYDFNYNSLGVMVKKDDYSMFLAGDIEKYDEPRLAEQILAENGPVDVLKVGHHGLDSSTSDVFVEAIQPSVGVVTHLKGVRPAEDAMLYEKFNGEENVVFTGDGTVVVDFTDNSDGLEVTKVASDYEKTIIKEEGK